MRVSQVLIDNLEFAVARHRTPDAFHLTRVVQKKRNDVGREPKREVTGFRFWHATNVSFAWVGVHCQEMKKLADKLQLWFYLAGFEKLARAVGKYGTPAVEQVISKAITLYNTRSIEVVKEEQRWTTEDYHFPKACGIIDFDRTFKNNDKVVLDHDIAWPKSKMDVN